MNEQNTIVWSEDKGGFSTFLTYTPDTGCSINNRHFSFHDGVPWEHNREVDENGDKVNRSSFYGNEVSTSVTTVFNQEASSAKVMKNLTIEGTGDWDVEISSDLESDIIDHTRIGTWAIGVVYQRGDLTSYAGKVWRSEINNNKNRLPGYNENWEEILLPRVPETRTIAATINADEFVNREGRKSGWLRSEIDSANNIDLNASNIYGIGFGQFTSIDEAENIGVKENDFVPDPASNIGIDGTASFVNSVIDLSSAVSVDDSYGFTYASPDHSQGFGLTGSANYSVQVIHSNQARFLSQADFAVSTNNTTYHVALAKEGTVYKLYVSSVVGDSTDVSFRFKNNDGESVYISTSVDSTEMVEVPFFDAGLAHVKTLTSSEFSDVISVSDSTIGTFYLVPDSAIEYYAQSSIPMLTTAQYPSMMLYDGSESTLFFGMPIDSNIQYNSAISLIYGNVVYENLTVVYLETDNEYLTGGAVVGIQLPVVLRNLLIDAGSTVAGVQDRFFFSDVFTVFNSAAIPTLSQGATYQGYATDGVLNNYLFITPASSGLTYPNNSTISIVVSSDIDTVRIDGATVFNVPTDQTLGGPAIRLTLDQDDVDALENIGVRANPDNLVQSFFTAPQIQIYTTETVPVTERGTTFKAVLDIDNTFVFSVPDGVVLADGAFASMAVEDSIVNNLNISDADFTSSDIIGGTTAAINLTADQAESIIQSGSLISGKFYYTADEVKMYTQANVPLVKRGTVIGGITSPVALREPQVEGTYELVFLIDRDISVSVGDSISMKFWRGSYANGVGVRSKTQIEPIEIENLTVYSVGVNPTFTESAIITNLSKAQADLIRGLNIVSRMSDPILRDEDLDPLEDTSSDIIRDGGLEVDEYFFIPVQVEIFAQPNVPFDKVDVNGRLPSHIADSDTLFYIKSEDIDLPEDQVSSRVTLAGPIREVRQESNVGTIEFNKGVNDNPPDGSYFFISKDKNSEGQGVKGHFFDVTLSTQDNNLAELFMVGANLVLSSE